MVDVVVVVPPSSVVVPPSSVVVSVEVVVSVRVSDSSGAEQELTPSARTDTRNRVSRMYRR